MREGFLPQRAGLWQHLPQLGADLYGCFCALRSTRGFFLWEASSVQSAPQHKQLGLPL